MDGSFWLGLLASFPIAIAANFASRPLFSWLDRWSGDAPLRRSANLKRRLARAERTKERIHRTAAMMAVLGLLSLMSLIGSVLFLILLTSRPGVSPDALVPWQGVPDEMKLTVIRDSLTSVFTMLSFAAATVMFL